MEFTVEFKLPDKTKISVTEEADSHWGASQEALFDGEVFERLLKTGKTRFGAKVTRQGDNVTRNVFVEIDKPQAAPRTHATVESAVSSEDRRVRVPDTGGGTCDVCTRQKVPSGFEVDCPAGVGLCSGCGIPLPGGEDSGKMEGWDEKPAEEPTPEQEEEVEQGEEAVSTKEEPSFRMPEGLTDEMIDVLRSQGLIPKLCENCGDTATEQDDAGNDLCEDCYLELLCEDDGPDDSVE